MTMPGPGAPSNVPDPPPTVNTMRTIGIVWMAVGGLAVVGGAVLTVFAVILFGLLAILLGAALYGVQQLRANSAERSARTLSNSPPPPASSPGAGSARPAPEPDPEPEPGPAAEDDEAEVVEEPPAEDPPSRS